MKTLRFILFFVVFLVFAANAYARTLLAVGDSEMLGIRPGITVAQTFVAKIGATCGFTTVHNGAVAGETTSQTLARLPALLTTYAPDVVFLAPSPNNFSQGMTIAQTKSDLLAMKGLAEAAGAKVVFFTYMIWANATYLHGYALQERAMMQELGGMQGVQFVDVFAEQTRWMFYNSYTPGAYNAPFRALYAVDSTGNPDWIHPSAIMHQIIHDLAMQNPAVCDP